MCHGDGLGLPCLRKEQCGGTESRFPCRGVYAALEDGLLQKYRMLSASHSVKSW